MEKLVLMELQGMEEAWKEVNLNVCIMAGWNIMLLQLNHLVMPLVQVRLVALEQTIPAVTKVAVVVVVACMVALHPKNWVLIPIILAAVAVVMSMQNLLMVRQLPVISPFCHLRAYQKRDMQVMVLL